MLLVNNNMIALCLICITVFQTNLMSSHGRELQHQFTSVFGKPLSQITSREISSCPAAISQGRSESSLFRYYFCRNECQTDADCNDNYHRGYICCPAAGCANARACTPAFKSCEQIYCDSGQVCISPQGEDAHCINKLPKDGQCPSTGVYKRWFSSECQSDYNCAGIQKCCSMDYQNSCQYPVLPELKPGECPNIPPDTGGLCVEKCSSDSSCLGDEKCCSNGCGHECTTPVLLKPGRCPNLPPNTIGTCAIECSPTTRPCPYDKVCCNNGCGSTCISPEPAKPKPGKCPYLPPGTIGTCIELCSGDLDCLDDKKCCSNGCGHVCKSPQEEPPLCTKRCKRRFHCQVICPFVPPCFETCALDQNVSCRFEPCPRGYCCKLQPLLCKKPPCPLRPICGLCDH